MPFSHGGVCLGVDHSTHIRQVRLGLKSCPAVVWLDAPIIPILLNMQAVSPSWAAERVAVVWKHIDSGSDAGIPVRTALAGASTYMLLGPALTATVNRL